MDTEVFLASCKEILDGTKGTLDLGSLADDLYASLSDGEAGSERDELVAQAKEKIRLYKALWADLEKLEEELKERRQEEVEASMSLYIDQIKQTLNEAGIVI